MLSITNLPIQSDATEIHIEDLFAPSNIGFVYLNLTIKSTGSGQCSIKNICTIGACGINDNDNDNDNMGGYVMRGGRVNRG